MTLPDAVTVQNAIAGSVAGTPAQGPGVRMPAVEDPAAVGDDTIALAGPGEERELVAFPFKLDALVTVAGRQPPVVIRDDFGVVVRGHMGGGKIIARALAQPDDARDADHCRHRGKRGV